MAKRYTQEEQRYHVKQWRHSGLSQKAYCAENRLSWSTFKNWSKRIAPNSLKAGFAPVRIAPSTDTRWIIETADGLRVHVPAQSDENELRALINLLRCCHAS